MFSMAKATSKTTTEEFKVEGSRLLDKVKELIHEGNVRRITIKDKTGKEIVAFPLTIGVVGTLIAPVLAAVGALAALLTECTLVVEKSK
jgi:hypothetical protein